MPRRVPTALLVALCLCGPQSVWAGPPMTAPGAAGVAPASPAETGPAGAGAALPPADPEQGAPREGAPTADPGDADGSATSPEAGAPEATRSPTEGDGAAAGTPETPEAVPQSTPQSGGMAGVIASDDPDATKATRELEGETLGSTLPAGVPERMSRLQRAAWWTMFGAIGLGATGGVFAGLVERQEDRAVRLQRTYDLDAGARPTYADVRAEYEGIVDRGEAYQATSISLLSVGAAAFVTSVVLFSVNAARTSRGESARAPTASGVGLGRMGAAPTAGDRTALHPRRGRRSIELVSPRAGLVEVRF